MGKEFTDVPYDADPNDDVAHFMARVFYTAKKHGIIEGYEDGTVRPLDNASLAETLAILQRSAHVIPDGYAMTTENWYEPYITFAVENAILDRSLLRPDQTLILRNHFAQLLIRHMRYSPDPRIYGYIERLDIFNETFADDRPIYRLIPNMVAFDVQPEAPVHAAAETGALTGTGIETGSGMTATGELLETDDAQEERSDLMTFMNAFFEAVYASVLGVMEWIAGALH